jgi:hypothetical protein
MYWFQYLALLTFQNSITVQHKMKLTFSCKTKSAQFYTSTTHPSAGLLMQQLDVVDEKGCRRNIQTSGITLFISI